MAKGFRFYLLPSAVRAKKDFLAIIILAIYTRKRNAFFIYQAIAIIPAEDHLSAA